MSRVAVVSPGTDAISALPGLPYVLDTPDTPQPSIALVKAAVAFGFILSVAPCGKVDGHDSRWIGFALGPDIIHITRDITE